MGLRFTLRGVMPGQSEGLPDSDRPAMRRRTLVKAIAGAAAVAQVPLIRAQSATFNFTSYGGSYGDAVNKHLVKPFEKESGLSVQQGVNQALAPVKIQVLSKNVQWDLVELAGGDFITGLRDDLFEPIDTNIVKLDKVPAFARHKFGIEYALFLSGIGYDQRKVSDADAPRTWAEVWDLNRYKGMRGLSKHVSDSPTLELALLAAGVPIDKLYPLNVELAFDSLKKLGIKNVHWFDNNQEPVNFLQQGLGPISQIASGRVAIANSKGAKIGFVYNQLQLNGDYLVVPKGSRNKEAAFRLMNFILNNDQAAVNWMTETTYALSNDKAVAMMPPDVASKLPTSPGMKGKFFEKNFEWWGANGPAVTVRFQQLIAS
ncbi:MAG: extracellular solute-binding protein [Betaproteobacteria bacterium]|nr:extracellular solute-binding protein [Betaproteobacteria bacterium]NDE73731.1 extracellular solute-binding protein [Betaproteobacteria bacterium]